MYINLPYKLEIGDTIAAIIEKIVQYPDEDLQIKVCCGMEVHKTTRTWELIFFPKDTTDNTLTDEHQRLRKFCKDHELSYTEPVEVKSSKKEKDTTTMEVLAHMLISIPKKRQQAILKKYYQELDGNRREKSDKVLKALKERAGGHYKKMARSSTFSVVLKEIAALFSSQLDALLEGESCFLFDNHTVKVECRAERIALNSYRYQFSDHKIQSLSSEPQRCALCALLLEEFAGTAGKKSRVRSCYWEQESDTCVNFHIEPKPDPSLKEW